MFEYDEVLYNEMRNNDIIMESFLSMGMDQEGKDRMHYTDTALEAFSNPSKQSALLNKLFKEAQKVESLDFGKIPDSKGDITKYVYYDQLCESMRILNELMEGKLTPNFETMNKLHNVILTARPDFTFGFRTDNFIIMNMYNLMVTVLYELNSICMLDATEYLRAKVSTQNVFNPSTIKKQFRWVTRNANQFIKMYESGQWNTMMKLFKTNKIDVATEADIDGADFSAKIDVRAGILKGIFGDKNSKTQGISGKVSNAWSAMKDFVRTGIPKPAQFLLVFIAVLMLIRSVVYYFYAGAGKISDRIKNAIGIIKANAATEDSETAIEKQKKMLQKLESVSDKIDYDIMKKEKAAEKSMKESNKAEFNPDEIRNINGSDFEI